MKYKGSTNQCCLIYSNSDINSCIDKGMAAVNQIKKLHCLLMCTTSSQKGKGICSGSNAAVCH